MYRVGITTGDPAGIGSEVLGSALRFRRLDKNIAYIIYGRKPDYVSGNEIKQITTVKDAVVGGKIYWINEDNKLIKPGDPSAESGRIALRILQQTANDLAGGLLDAVVTGPVSKKHIRITAENFIGHTEFFAEKINVKDVVMSFWGPVFNLSLLTTHLPLASVSSLLTRDFIMRKLRIIISETNKFIETPRFAFLGINPHAGEESAFGEEEVTIRNVVEELQNEGINIEGPFSADSFFCRNLNKYDMIISAAHDQGLIPFKLLSEDKGVNVTLGLPFYRASVDHGTAFDIAGKGIAKDTSAAKAINFVEKALTGRDSIDAQIYNRFAYIYDDYMSHVDYKDWVEFILTTYRKMTQKNPDRIIELACGTANVSSLMVEQGLLVDACDFSSDMLKVASRKKHAPNLFLRSLTEDLGEDKYNLVLLLFDSINYLIKEGDISLLLCNVAKALQENGLFIFDISTIFNTEENFDGYVNIEDKENIFITQESDFSRRKRVQQNKVTIFEKDGFCHKKYQEIHKQMIYRTTDIVSYVSSSGLTLKGIHVIGDSRNLLQSIKPLSRLDDLFSRLFFVVQKNK
ncbi:MAG: 4-hydroxythreonine-4-phosphate dehydrogenase PdxA [Candidatus Cloacimonetes bacterium]|nr:4-hydroxythreonine-4-phosphate dehydrogenase PdxA [Candidatus Cloacimonadota bacterium]